MASLATGLSANPISSIKVYPDSDMDNYNRLAGSDKNEKINTKVF
jgi:hypothetical protein